MSAFAETEEERMLFEVEDLCFFTPHYLTLCMQSLRLLKMQF